MNKLSKIIIGIMSAIIVCLCIVIIVLLIELKKYNTKPNTPSVEDMQIQNAVGIYYSQEKINYTNETLKLNKDMTCEYSLIDANCKWSISDDNITLTYTWYKISDDTKYTDDYYNNDNINSYGTTYHLSKKRCEDNLKRISEQESLANAKCIDYATQDEQVILINNGVLYNNFKFNKIK